jgi:imidazoleglycerol-phosphate dehydratase
MDQLKVRYGTVSRITNETDVKLNIDIDGIGKNNITTGIGFFDHMLQLFSQHGFFDLEIAASGDLQVDGHHTVEDVGIALGMAIKNALADKKGIRRYGSFLLPMDEALVLCAIDLSGRPFLVFDAQIPGNFVGSFDTELVEEFFRAVAFHAGMNLHIKLFYGKNTHHMIEAMFKAFARALDEATSYDSRINGVMSTKGSLE